MKSSFRTLPFNLYLIFYFSLFIFTSCNTKEEGCLDIRATNFAFDADKACSDCCTFPKLFFRVSHVWNDSTPFRQNNVYVTPENDTFKIVDLDFAFSAFRLEDELGLQDSIDETIEIWCDANNLLNKVEISQDIIVINLTNLSYPIGTFRRDEHFPKGKMHVGIPEKYDCAVADSIENNGPLSTQSVLYQQETQSRRFGRIVIQKDTSSITLDTLYLPNIQQEFEFNIGRTFKTGKPDTIYSRILYEQWFDQIHIRNDPNEMIIEKLMLNIPPSVEIN